MDKHLNCFYSYNHDNELIENNLTRAFIVTLWGISGKTRNRFFSNLSSINPIFSEIDFSAAGFALQSNINCDLKAFNKKYVLTLATDTIFLHEQEIRRIGDPLVRKTMMTHTPPRDLPSTMQAVLESLCYGSIPDAWIYDKVNMDYCLLIECKKLSASIEFPQIIRHAHKQFGLDRLEEIDRHTIRLTWYDIIDCLLFTKSGDNCSNEQEEFLLGNLLDYLGFVGYHPFKGFRFHRVTSPPNYKFRYVATQLETTLFNFRNLPSEPKFRINISTPTELFFFNKQRDMANFDLIFSSIPSPKSNLFNFSGICNNPNITISNIGGK